MADSNSIFDRSHFPDSLYKVYMHGYDFHDFHITISNVIGADHSVNSFVEITQRGKSIYHKCFPMIAVLGGEAGVYSDDRDHFGRYFFVSKFGDYQGSLIILNEKGQIKELLGSTFYISKSLNLIFTDQDQDVGGLTIYDLVKNKILYDSNKQFNKGDYSETEMYISSIRYDQNYHYLVYLKDSADIGNPKLYVLKVNYDKGTAIPDSLDNKFLMSLPELSYHNWPRSDDFTYNPTTH